MISFFKPIRPLFKGWLLALLGWGSVGLIMAAQGVITRGDTWHSHLAPSIFHWLPWVIITHLLFRLVARFPIDQYGWKLALPVHLICGLLVIVVLQFWRKEHFARLSPRPGLFPAPFQPLDRMKNGPPPFGNIPAVTIEEHGPPLGMGPPPSTIRGMHVIDLFTRELPIYLMCLAGAHALVFFKRDQEQSERLVRARLDALQMQLQPHFLFNSLNAIASLIPTHPAKAENLVEALSDLLRHRLNDAEAHEVPLAEEISFLRRYLELMHARFEERLRYHIDSPAELDDALVPSMLLQPLVENAIEHGLRPKSGGGTVEVRASRVEGSNLLRLDIIDDGVGMNPDRPMEENIGLGNTRARLHDLYGSGSSLILQSGPGTTVSVTLPLHFR